MVATVLTLKFRTMGHQLRREWWRMLMLAVGAVWSLSLIPALFWARLNLSYAPMDVRLTTAVLVTTVLCVGWLIVPVLITGLDDTLDPGRFASLGVEAKALMPGLTVAQFLTLPAIYVGGVLIALSTVWSTRWAGYAPNVLGVVGSALSLAVMVLAARVVVMWATRTLSSVRGRALAALGMLGLIAAAVALSMWLMADGLDDVLQYVIPALVSGASMTPLGAGAALPQLAVTGQWFAVGWRIAMLVAVIWVLHRAWRGYVAYTLVNPVYRGGGTRRRRDTIERRVGAARTMRGATAAVVARQRRYWMGDPRYVVSLAGVAAFPLVYLVMVMPVLGLDARWAYVAPLLLAASAGWGRHNDLAFDSSAVWMDIVAGNVGLAVMRGRMLALLEWAVPLVLVTVAAVALLTQEWQFALPVAGASLGVLGVTLGISSVSSVVFPYRAPAPGENPFGAEVGSVGASLVAQLASSAVALGAIPLVTFPLFLALTVDPGWSWAALVVGMILGPAAAVGGTTAAGRIYDRRSGSLLAAVT